MNKKQALLVIAGVGSVLCTPVKQNSIKVEKIGSLIEQSEIKELKKSVALSEKPKEIISLPSKKELDKQAICLEKITSNEKKEKSLPEMIKKLVSRIVEISNNITKDMITYRKHWTGNYTPSKFILKINGQEIKQNSTIPITVTENKACASFNYEFKVFGKVQRVGGREFDLVVPENADKLISTFSWDEPSNLVFNQGKLINSKDIK